MRPFVYIFWFWNCIIWYLLLLLSSEQTKTWMIAADFKTTLCHSVANLRVEPALQISVTHTNGNRKFRQDIIVVVENQFWVMRFNILFSLRNLTTQAPSLCVYFAFFSSICPGVNHSECTKKHKLQVSSSIITPTHPEVCIKPNSNNSRNKLFNFSAQFNASYKAER